MKIGSTGKNQKNDSPKKSITLNLNAPVKKKRKNLYQVPQPPPKRERKKIFIRHFPRKKGNVFEMIDRLKIIRPRSSLIPVRIFY